MADYASIGEKFGIIYTCNCGWLDRAHSHTRSSRPMVGSDWLWASLLGERGPAITFLDRPAYVLSYRQDAVKKVLGMKFYPGTTRQYVVRRGLSFHERAQVGLAIFQEVSLDFEAQQDSWIARKATGTDSGFSEEDLVSNIIGFYKSVYPLIDVNALCKPVSVEASREVWRAHGAVGQNKNRAFTPHLYACSECTGLPVFPPQFQTITPAVRGTGLFDDWAPYSYRTQPYR